MNFFKQLTPNTCQITALQTVLSHYGKFPTLSEIKKTLPKHSFGDLITELAIYLEMQSIPTSLISNKANIRATNTLFHDTLNRYTSIGDFQDKLFPENDLTHGPVIANIDLSKLQKSANKKIPHYVVLLKKDNILWLYDGASHNEPQQITFQEIQTVSKDINRWKDDGMFLVCRDTLDTKL